MKTLVGSDESGGPGGPSAVVLYVKPGRDENDPDGYLIWLGTLDLLEKVRLAARSLPDLVVLARRRLIETVPDERIELRIVLFPDLAPATNRFGEVVELTLTPWNGA